MNRMQTALKIREQFDGFMGIVSPHFSKPLYKFLNQMIFGLQSGKEIKFSNVARSQSEAAWPRRTDDPRRGARVRQEAADAAD